MNRYLGGLFDRPVTVLNGSDPDHYVGNAFRFFVNLEFIAEEHAALNTWRDIGWGLIRDQIPWGRNRRRRPLNFALDVAPALCKGSSAKSQEGAQRQYVGEAVSPKR